MKWSWKIGTFGGIAVYVHATFLLLLAGIYFVPVAFGHGLYPGLAGVVFALLLFACVVLHEFGHALTARRFGVTTRDITLYPIGGAARLERIPRDPRQELLIAVAGPAVNVVIAALLCAVMVLLRAPIAVLSPQASGGGASLLRDLLLVNLMLVGFNILPAFPMDGGRVLRACLAQRMEYGRATQIAAWVGQGMALLFGLLGLVWNPFLLFIALFVYMGAAEEAATVQAELAFRGFPVRAAMMTRFATLSPADPLSRATGLLLAGTQNDFPVVDEGRTVGPLTRAALVRALSAGGPDVPVAGAMQPVPAAASPSDSLEATFQRMREHQAQIVPVEEAGRLIGALTLENISEFLMIRSALRGAPPPSGRRERASLPTS